MLFVEVYVNQTLISRLGAQRIKGDTHADSRNIYRLDDYTEIKHRYGDGAERLAIKMLKHDIKRKKKSS